MIRDVFTILSIVTGFIGVVGPVGAVIACIAVPGIAIPALKMLTTRFLSCHICVGAVLILLACLGSYWVGNWGEYDRGKNETVAKFARGDAKLTAKALAARSKMNDCKARGMAWSQSTGECR